MKQTKMGAVIFLIVGVFFIQNSHSAQVNQNNESSIDYENGLSIGRINSVTTGDSGGEAVDENNTPLAVYMTKTAVFDERVAVDENNISLDSSTAVLPAYETSFEPNAFVAPTLKNQYIFPATGDVRFNFSGDRFWHDGDYVEGTRQILSRFNSIYMTLEIGPNSLSCDTQDHQLMIDGVVVGSFSVSSGDTQVVKSFNFSEMAAGSHTFRIETTRTVAGGCGSAGLPNDVSVLSYPLNEEEACFVLRTKTGKVSAFCL